jgi:hypothetical protein
LRLADRGIDLTALLIEPRPLGRDRGILRRRVLRRQRAKPFQPRVELGEPRLEVGDLVAQLIAQRREAQRQIGQGLRAEAGPARRSLDLVERSPDRIDADQRGLLLGGGRRDERGQNGDQAEHANHGGESEHGGLEGCGARSFACRTPCQAGHFPLFRRSHMV